MDAAVGGKENGKKKNSYFHKHLWVVLHSNDVFDKFHGVYYFFFNIERKRKISSCTGVFSGEQTFFDN